MLKALHPRSESVGDNTARAARRVLAAAAGSPSLASTASDEMDVSPGAVASFLTKQAATNGAAINLGNAALAFGAAFGTPVTLTTSLLCDEISTAQHASGTTGVVIGIGCRDSGPEGLPPYSDTRSSRKGMVRILLRYYRVDIRPVAGSTQERALIVAA